MGNTFGHLFRVTTFGESHGGGVGVVIDGCPPRIPISEDEIQYELDRRKPGQSEIVTPRKESDKVKILSGVFEGKTTGTPICMLVINEDARPEAYREIAEKFRPSHADYTYFIKYGIRNWQGGGRSSARETIGRVAAGTIAKKILKKKYGIEILAYVQQIHKIKANIDRTKITLSDIESNIVRCPDQATAKEMETLIKNIRAKGDSVGGIIECVARNVPPGLGDPVFDKLQADLAKAMLSIPAVKGFDYGSGFECVNYTGTEHNDPFRIKDNKVITSTNLSGGIQGGISNGELIYFRVAFKPVATVMKEQQTVDIHFQETMLKATGRHDPCVLPRAVPVVESMCALVLIDHAMRHESQCK